MVRPARCSPCTPSRPCGALDCDRCHPGGGDVMTCADCGGEYYRYEETLCEQCGKQLCPECVKPGTQCSECFTGGFMDDQTKLPKRGEWDADRMVYTHTDGSVHRRDNSRDSCHVCSLGDKVAQFPCGVDCRDGVLVEVKSAYVPSDPEQKACDMARRMIDQCQHFRNHRCDQPFAVCPRWASSDCPARRYLADMKQPDAWLVN